MRTQVIRRTLYTAAELKEHHPRGFEQAWFAFANDEGRWYDPSEELDSMKAARDAIEWEPYGYYTTAEGEEALSILADLLPEDKDGGCYLTGVCFDADMVQHIWERVRQGDNLWTAGKTLEDVVNRLVDAEVEYLCSEENFLDMADANGWEFTASGELV